MAVYTKGRETKRQLVDLMCRKLRTRDAASLSVREIADEQGCSAAAIYRHFDSFNELIVVASVRFLHEYMDEYAELMESGKPFINLYVEGWRLFSRYAFERPDLYYRLFWGEDNPRLSTAAQEYYDLYPFDAPENAEAYYNSLMFEDNMADRDYFLLDRAVGSGLVSERDARYFSESNALIIRGMLREAMGQDASRRHELEQRSCELIEMNMNRDPWR